MTAKRLYLDTSIISAYFDIRQPIRLLKTVEWIKHEANKFDLYISTLVIEKLSATKILK